MGCDYYKNTNIIVEYKSQNNETKRRIFTIDQECGYIYDGSYDSDFERMADYLVKLDNNYKDKDLYKDGKWLCLEDRISIYTRYIKEIENMKELIRVYKNICHIERW